MHSDTTEKLPYSPHCLSLLHLWMKMKLFCSNSHLQKLGLSMFTSPWYPPMSNCHTISRKHLSNKIMTQMSLLTWLQNIKFGIKTCKISTLKHFCTKPLILLKALPSLPWLLTQLKINEPHPPSVRFSKAEDAVLYSISLACFYGKQSSHETVTSYF